MKKSFWGISLFFFLIATQVPIIALAQASDVYAIYSNLISKSPVVRTGPGNVPTDDEVYLIEAKTVSEPIGIGGMRSPLFEPANSCGQIPPAEATGFQEILADYKQRKGISVILLPQFKMAKSYRFLSPIEAEKFLKDAQDATPRSQPAGIAKPVNRNPLYQKSKRVFRLGDVYFNKSRTLALVYFSVYKTTSDGSGGWRPFRKTAAGQWEENKAWGCSAWGALR